MARAQKTKEMPKMRRLFAERLRAARVTRGFARQKDLADRLGIEHERYRMWERGDREPDITHLVLISKELQISLDFLLLGEPQAPGLKAAKSA